MPAVVICSRYALHGPMACPGALKGRAWLPTDCTETPPRWDHGTMTRALTMVSTMLDAVMSSKMAAPVTATAAGLSSVFSQVFDRYSVVLSKDSCSFLLTSSDAARTATRRAGWATAGEMTDRKGT